MVKCWEKKLKKDAISGALFTLSMSLFKQNSHRKVGARYVIVIIFWFQILETLSSKSYVVEIVFHLASGFWVQVNCGQHFSFNGACVDKADVVKLRKGFTDFLIKIMSEISPLWNLDLDWKCMLSKIRIQVQDRHLILLFQYSLWFQLLLLLASDIRNRFQLQL